MDRVVYIHRDDCGEVFYVGQGLEKRAYANLVRTSAWRRRAGRKRASIYKPAKTWYERHYEPTYTVEITHRNLNKEEALQIERDLIDKYGIIRDGSGCLVNNCKK